MSITVHLWVLVSSAEWYAVGAFSGIASLCVWIAIEGLVVRAILNAVRLMMAAFSGMSVLTLLELNFRVCVSDRVVRLRWAQV